MPKYTLEELKRFVELDEFVDKSLETGTKLAKDTVDQLAKLTKKIGLDAEYAKCILLEKGEKVNRPIDVDILADYIMKTAIEPKYKITSQEQGKNIKKSMIKQIEELYNRPDPNVSMQYLKSSLSVLVQKEFNLETESSVAEQRAQNMRHAGLESGATSPENFAKANANRIGANRGGRC